MAQVCPPCSLKDFVALKIQFSWFRGREVQIQKLGDSVKQERWNFGLLGIPGPTGFWPSFRQIIGAIQGMQSRESNSPNGNQSRAGFLHINPPTLPHQGLQTLALVKFPISSNLLLVLVIKSKLCSKHKVLLIGSFLSLTPKISYILVRLLRGRVGQEGRKFNSLVTRAGLRGHYKSG